jgi:hypothetical protein
MRNGFGWSWFLGLAVSTAMLAGCGAALPPATATPLNPPTPLPLPTAQRQASAVPPGLSTTPPSLAATPRGGDQVNLDPNLAQLVEKARADLAQRLVSPAESFTLKRAEQVEWRDASLGCPQPGMVYAQVITPGYLIVLETNGKEYEYHADRRRVLLCEK